MTDFAEAFAEAESRWDVTKSPAMQKRAGEDAPAAAAFDEMFGKPATKLPHVVAIIEVEQRLRQQRQKGFYGDAESIMPGFHPSFISGTDCQAAYWYSLGDHDRDDVEPKLQRIFDNGSDVHSRIQAYLAPRLVGTWRCRKCQATHGQQPAYMKFLREHAHNNPGYADEIAHTATESADPIPMPEQCVTCGRKTADEFNPLFVYKEWRIIDPETGIVGKTDGILVYEGKYIPIEIKSANNRVCTGLPRYNATIKYRKQFQLYIDRLLAQHPQLPFTKGGVFIYENKDNQQLIELECWLDENVVGPIKQRCQKVLSEGRGRAVLNDDCRECPYAQQCVKDGRDER